MNDVSSKSQADASQTDEYVVIGNPVGHSLSPRIHALFAKQTGCNIRYGTLFSERDRFVETANGFFSQGGHGANVTVPFKEDASRFADQLSPRARLAQAVNTLKRHDDGHIEGDNTDGAGLLRDLTDNLGLKPEALRILMLGAGGAAYGVTEGLLSAHPRTLVVANRTADKAMALADRFADLGEISGVGLSRAGEDGPFDLVINATSAGLAGSALPELPSDLFAEGATAYDMIYADAPTPFLRWAGDEGAARCVDGLGMLLEQAAEAFWLWRGKRPSTAPVRKVLRPTISSPETTAEHS